VRQSRQHNSDVVGVADCAYALDLCSNLGDLLDADLDEFVVVHLQPDHPVPARRAREGTAMRQAAGGPDRDPSPLYRTGQEYGPVDAVVRSDMMCRFSREQAVDDLQALVESLGQDPRIGWLAERAVLGLDGGTLADAEDRSTAECLASRAYKDRPDLKPPRILLLSQRLQHARVTRQKGGTKSVQIPHDLRDQGEHGEDALYPRPPGTLFEAALQHSSREEVRSRSVTVYRAVFGAGSGSADPLE
jgi:hypothetical protein